MAADEVLRARVDRRLARKVQRWAKEHDATVSDTVRIAVTRLIEEDLRARRLRKALREFDDHAEEGLFDPPEGTTKGGGFR